MLETTSEGEKAPLPRRGLRRRPRPLVERARVVDENGHLLCCISSVVFRTTWITPNTINNQTKS